MRKLRTEKLSKLSKVIVCWPAMTMKSVLDKINLVLAKVGVFYCLGIYLSQSR